MAHRAIHVMALPGEDLPNGQNPPAPRFLQRKSVPTTPVAEADQWVDEQQWLAGFPSNWDGRRGLWWPGF